MLFGGARKGWEGESCLEEKGGLCAVGSPGFLQVPPLFLYRVGILFGPWGLVLHRPERKVRGCHMKVLGPRPA